MPKVDWSKVDHERVQRAPGARWPKRDVLDLWKAHGGEWHGPRVETVTMPMYLLTAFLDAYVSDRLAAELAAARAEVAAARNAGLEEAAKIAEDASISADQEAGIAQSLEDDELARNMFARGAEAQRIARLIRAARTAETRS